ncbi:MAG: ATP-binding protein [Eubacteriales bacterium]|jgi:signal transduction histidine kinase|nr:ATP-binding protein [Eubacteriales bacterium]
MKRIRNSILNPFAWLIVMMTVLVLIVFNFAIRKSVEGFIRSELERSIVRATDMVDIRLDPSSPYKQTAEKYQIIIHDFMRISRQTANVEVLILGNGGKVLYPETFDGSALTDAVADIAYEASYPAGGIVRFSEGGGFYLAEYKEFHIADGQYISLLFVGVLAGALEIVTIVNITLVAVLIVVSVAAILLSSKIARKISGPITATATAALRISQGEFVQVIEDRSSQESYELTKSINKMSEHLQLYYELQTGAMQHAAHELRTPLMSIQGYAEGIENEVFSDNKHAASVIVSECKRLNRLVGELLTLSRIENDAYYQNFAAIDLARIIRIVTEKVGGYREKRRKNLISAAVPEHIVVKAHEDLLVQALLNVVYNGLRYAKSRVDISVQANHAFAQIIVRDDGCGISEQDLPHVFDRFYKGPGGNFGLGLSITKSALDYMGGDIACHNDHGAVFSIRVPLSE